MKSCAKCGVDLPRDYSYRDYYGFIICPDCRAIRAAADQARSARETLESQERQEEAQRQALEQERKSNPKRWYGHEWVEKLLSNPKVASHMEWDDWEKLDGDDWCSLLAGGESFAKNCDKANGWGKFSTCHWVNVLRKTPDLREKCPDTVIEQFEEKDWVRLLNAQPQFLSEGMSKIKTNSAWLELVSENLEMGRYCPWAEFGTEEWRALLKKYGKCYVKEQKTVLDEGSLASFMTFVEAERRKKKEKEEQKQREILAQKVAEEKKRARMEQEELEEKARQKAKERAETAQGCGCLLVLAALVVLVIFGPEWFGYNFWGNTLWWIREVFVVWFD